MWTPTEIWALASSILAAIILLVNAAEKIVKVVKVAKAPMNEQNERLDKLETDMKEVQCKLSQDHERFESIDASNRVTQRALLALLDHGIDGNNIEQMQHAKEALQNHLING